MFFAGPQHLTSDATYKKKKPLTLSISRLYFIITFERGVCLKSSKRSGLHTDVYILFFVNLCISGSLKRVGHIAKAFGGVINLVCQFITSNLLFSTAKPMIQADR